MLWIKLSLVICLFFVMQIWETSSNDVYFIQATRIDCKFDQQVVKNGSGKCWIKLVRKSSNLVNVVAQFVRPVKKVSLKITIFYRFNTVYSFFAINFTTNVCDEIGWSKPYYKPNVHTAIYYDAFKKYSDLIRPCPYQNNFSLTNCPADAFRFPPFVPAGDYRVDYTMNFDGFISLVQVYSNVKAKGLHTLKMG